MLVLSANLQTLTKVGFELLVIEPLVDLEVNFVVQVGVVGEEGRVAQKGPFFFGELEVHLFEIDFL